MAPSRGGKPKTTGKSQPPKRQSSKPVPKTSTPTTTTTTTTNTPSSPPSPDQQISQDLQQQLLNIFRRSFAARLGPDLTPLLQEVKQHLYNRDFVRAFGREDYLEAYAARWSASRALCYVQVFEKAAEYLSGLKEEQGEDISDGGDGDDGAATHPQSAGPASAAGATLNVACLGGGAGAEVVALAGLLNLLDRRHRTPDTSSTTTTSTSPPSADPGAAGETGTRPPVSAGLNLSVSAIDIADWSAVLNALRTSITTPPPLSKYASASARAAAADPLVPGERFSARFCRGDVLQLGAREASPESSPEAGPEPSSELSAGILEVVKEADLVTLMFTLNELYSTSLAQTQRFLQALTRAMKRGALLLVVDSPGSYSTVALGGKEEEGGKGERRKYPMHWLLDLALLGGVNGGGVGGGEVGRGRGENGEKRWEKLETEETKWFRLPKGLKYPIELEDMRFQLHLYRRC